MIKAALLLVAASSTSAQVDRVTACDLMQSEGIDRVSCEAHYQNVFAHSWNAEMSTAERSRLLAECELEGVTPARQAFFDAFKKDVYSNWPNFSPAAASKERWREVAWLSAKLCMMEER